MSTDKHFLEFCSFQFSFLLAKNAPVKYKRFACAWHAHCIQYLDFKLLFSNATTESAQHGEPFQYWTVQDSSVCGFPAQDYSDRENDEQRLYVSQRVSFL